MEQRQREIEAQKQQVDMIEQCHQRELDNLQTALQASFNLTVKWTHHLLFFFFKEFITKDRFFSVSEHQSGAGVSAGGVEQHQEGQVYAAGKSG